MFLCYEINVYNCHVNLKIYNSISMLNFLKHYNKSLLNHIFAVNAWEICMQGKYSVQFKKNKKLFKVN